jgi:eukaryotic-like serine/threonine-protein kinase
MVSDGGARTSSRHLEPGTVVLGRYRIVGMLGEGGMGSVLEAVNTVTDKRVALKWLKPSTSTAKDAAVHQRRLLREAKVSSRVHHPNLVDIYDVGEEHGAVCLVMELLRGRSLEQWMVEHPKPSSEVALALVVPALRGLSALHAAGIVHRDLKPQNLFVCEDETGAVVATKILDFGLALDTRVVSSLTASGQMLGTPAYMAPEQIERPDVDLRCDIYAAGVILYEALASRLPFEATSIARLLKAVLDEPPIPLATLRPDLEPGVCAVIMRAMSRRPEDRPSNVADLLSALQPYVSNATGGPLLAPGLRPVRTTAWAPVSLGAVLLLAFLAGMMWVSGRPFGSVVPPPADAARASTPPPGLRTISSEPANGLDTNAESRRRDIAPSDAAHDEPPSPTRPDPVQSEAPRPPPSAPRARRRSSELAPGSLEAAPPNPARPVTTERRLRVDDF